MSEPKKNGGFHRTPAGHSTIICLVGCYLVYCGAQIGYGAFHGDASMPFWLSIVSCVFFALCGVGVLFYGWKIWNDADKARKKAEQQDDPGEK